ncbi:aldo/keto reductase [Candidatus Dojkabacteria bacterium]|nr:aldo/keto reductase [Candidatus Dojkabacteria bacterium]
MQAINLNNNTKMPILGLGTWKSDPGKVGAAIEYAILEAGYRHIDCAAIYGNEKEIGEALQKVWKQGIKREEIFITSKLWNTKHNPERVEAACRKTLEDLQLEYLDLYLMHWGIAFEPDRGNEPLDKNGVIKTENIPTRKTWESMQTLVNKDFVKSIGVANFTAAMIIDLLNYAKIKPVINQIELHPYNSQLELIKFCKYKDIELTAYSPLGNPSLAGNMSPLNAPPIQKIAKKYKKTSAQILLRWSIEREVIAIPKSTTPKRIKENSEVFDFKLDQKDLEQINALNQNHRFVNPADWWGIPYFS